MANSSNVLQVLIQTIKDAGNFNLIRFKNLRYKDYPFFASKEFITSMIGIHEELLEKVDYLEHLPCNTVDDLEKKRIKARRYCELFTQLHSLLKIVEMGGREYVPDFIAQLIGKRIKLINPKAELIFLPEYEYNFFYLELITPLKEALRDAVSDVKKYFSFADKLPVFWFPLAHKENMLLISLNGHEFGHFVNEEKNIVSKLIPKLVILPNEIEAIVTERMKTRYKAEKKEFKLDEYFHKQTLRLNVKKDVLSKISNQLKELISDAVGFCVFGPAFLIAQYNYLASFANLGHKSEGYPTIKTRLSFLMALYDFKKYPEQIKNTETFMNFRHQDIVDKFSNIITEIKSILKQSVVVPQDEEEKLVDKSIQNLEKNLWIEVTKAIKGQEYTPNIFCKDVFKLADLIDSVVPPAEIDFQTPANTISIVNVGVIYTLTSMDRLHETFGDKSVKDQLSTRNKFHKLIMKAGELSQIQKLMQSSGIDKEQNK